MSADLDTLTAPAADALRFGLGVFMSDVVLEQAPEHRHGPLAGLQDHLMAAGAGGPVSGVHLPVLGVVVVMQSDAIAATGVDAPRLFRVLSAAKDPYLAERADSR